MNFSDFFKKATGYSPFPYQKRLAELDIRRAALAAPTGAGKTAAAVLAWLWKRQHRPVETPKRLLLCEPQRTLVEQVFGEVRVWLQNLGLANSISLHAMQGGYIDEEWELTPERPSIIVGTQDQLLSRALNRGYAMSRYRWPIHFGLFHNDVQWVFDEIQLMGPGLTTSAQLHGIREALHFGQANSLWMSATLNLDWLSTVDHQSDGVEVCPFQAEDREALAERLHAAKPLFPLPARLEKTTKSETKTYLDRLSEQIAELHTKGRFTLVILNTVDRARELFERLRRLNPNQAIYLLHSRFRPVDRKAVIDEALDPDIKDKIVISTQVVEAGVDISADTLVTELAPKASLVQRFGRCNRRGDKPHAQVHWVDLQGDESVAAPYLLADIDLAREMLDELDSVEPARFLDGIQEDWPLYDTLRKRDLLELFDTTGDLSGLDTDIGRFIRDGEERDVFVYWRKWGGNVPPISLAAPHQGELCKARMTDLRQKIKDLDLWLLDTLKGSVATWRPASRADIVPGRTFLLRCKDGCYNPSTGWDSNHKGDVAEIAPESITSPFPTMGGDRLSISVPQNLTLAAHTAHVCSELDGVLRSLSTLDVSVKSTLKHAAVWHDVGKAHAVFQETMRKGMSAPREGVLYAKCESGSYHSRRYFRHELASALAALHNGLDFLLVYLVASHHGKARLSVRAFPDEEEGAILGIREGEELPGLELPGLKLPPTPLSLKPFRIGRGSWQDRALQLRAKYGPFRLAYLEALLRAADVRASKKEKEGFYVN